MGSTINLTCYLCYRRWVIKATIKQLQRPLRPLSLPRADDLSATPTRSDRGRYPNTWQSISNSLDINYHAVWVFRLNDSRIVEERDTLCDRVGPHSPVFLFPFLFLLRFGWQFDCVAFCALIETRRPENEVVSRPGMWSLLSCCPFPTTLSLRTAFGPHRARSVISLSNLSLGRLVRPAGRICQSIIID